MEMDFFNRQVVDKLFTESWFSKSLNINSGAKLWSEGRVTILNQPSYELTIPINWLDDPYNHRSWRWILNSFQWMDKLLADFKLNYNIESIEKCVAYFFDWASFYIIKNQEGEFLWKDDAVSFRTFRLSIIAYYIINSGLYNKDQVELTNLILQRHFIELSEPKNFKSNNHGIFQMRALMSLMTLHPNIGNISEVRKYVTKRLNWLWTRQYGSQNMHLENSTGYHQYIVEEFDQILDSPEFVNVKFIFDKSKITEVKENAKFLFHPNGTATLFGDSNFVSQTHEITIGNHLFNEAGYAILAGDDNSKNNSYLAIRTGFPSNAHRHSDDFSFEWSEKGQIIFQDSGRYSYDYDDPFRVFVSSTKAHNTVTVNNSNFPWWGDFKKTDFYSGAIQSLHSTSEKVELNLLKEFPTLNVKFSRKFNLKYGNYLGITDVLISDKKNTYEQWFHLAEDFNYLGKLENERLVFANDKIRIEVIVPRNTETMIIKGQQEPYIQGWVSLSEKKLLPRWSFGFKATAKSFRFNTKIIVI